MDVTLPPRRALAVGAHPDDVEFGCGATLAKWASGGCVVDLVVLTDGSKGSWDPDADLDALVAERGAEQLVAAQELGATGEVVMLGRTDGELVADRTLRDELAGWIRRLRPDVVLGHDPWKRYRLHPDHRAAGWATLDSIVAARDPHYLAGSDLAPHRPGQLWLFEADEADHAEDVSGFETTKVAALLAHRSQHLSTMGVADDDDGTQLAAFSARVVTELAEAGAASGLALAERFKVMDEL